MIFIQNSTFIQDGSVKYISPLQALATIALAHPSVDLAGIQVALAYPEITFRKWKVPSLFKK